ncbi:MAG: hypothetical protein HYZ75_07825 [Elusimicrobia bacterium]|nr:hypothetical protein [Elusimicrobiota bacterium]
MRYVLLLACLLLPVPPCSAAADAKAAAAPTQADLDEFAKKYRAAFEKQDTKALKPLYYADGPGGEAAFADEMKYLSAVMKSKLTDVSVKKAKYHAPPKDARRALNLRNAYELHIGFTTEKGESDSVLIPLGSKDGSLRLALLVPYSQSVEAADELSPEDIPEEPASVKFVPELKALIRACPNEINLFCAKQTGKTRTLVACLEKNRNGLTRRCRTTLDVPPDDEAP